MTSNVPHHFWSQFVLLCFLSLLSVGAAAGYSADSKTVDAEEFFESVQWTAMGFLEASSANQQKGGDEKFRQFQLKVCALDLAFAIHEAVFRKNERSLLRKQFTERFLTFYTVEKNIRALFNKCKPGLLTTDEFAEFLASSIAKPRQLTDSSSISSNPDQYIGKAVEIEGLAQVIVGVVFLSKNADDLNPIRVEISNLPSKVKADLFRDCGQFSSNCQVRLSASLATDSSGYFLQANLLHRIGRKAK